MKMSFFVKSLVSSALSSAAQRINPNPTPAPIIVTPTAQELKLRTEEFDRYQMAETIKGLEKAIFHLAANVTDLVVQSKRVEEILVSLTTSHEELLHTIDMASSNENEEYTHNSSIQQQNDEDEVVLNQLWNENAKKGNLSN